MAVTLGKARLLGIPVTMVIAGAALASVPVEAAVTAPCDMRVNLNPTSVQTYANGVERAVYTAKVTWGSRSQTAEVHRMVMPTGVTPRLLTKKLGDTGQLRSQLESKRGKRGVAAVNGDFFYGFRIEGRTVYLPRSASVTHGKPVRLFRDRMRVVGVDKNGDNYMGEVGVEGTVAHGSKVFKVAGVNWHSVGDGGVVVFTHAWSSASHAPRPEGAVEWVVKRNKVIDVRTGRQMGKSFPRGSKVVAFGRDHAAVAKRAKKGSAAIIGLNQTTRSGVPLREAVGRGLALVEAGEVRPLCTTANNLLRPRTTVGWTASGRWMSMTVPGTGYDRNGFRIGGLGLSQEAAVAAALNFDGASELDGGGSTTAYIRRADNDWDRVDDKDSIWQRPLPNALVFIKNK